MSQNLCSSSLCAKQEVTAVVLRIDVIDNVAFQCFETHFTDRQETTSQVNGKVKHIITEYIIKRYYLTIL